MSIMKRIQIGYDRLHDSLYSSRIKKLGGAKEVFSDRLRTPWHRLAFSLFSTLKVKDRRILDVGCGYGACSIALAQLGAQVVGLDISKRATRISKEMSEKLDVKIDMIQGDAQIIPCASGVFDIIVVCETLEHVPNLRKALAEIFRCVKLGSCVILTFPNVINPIGIYQRIASKQPFERSLSLSRMIREIRKLKNTRAKIISVKATFDFGFLENIEESFQKMFGSRIGLVVRRLEDLDEDSR
jgi:2-polyprenyl-3-methyl-5-hydroxy-6-metoxy-1,4-benzoquinol methylase